MLRAKRKKTEKRAFIIFSSLVVVSLAIGLLLKPDNRLFGLFQTQTSDPGAKVIMGPYPTALDFKILSTRGVTTIISLLDPAVPYESGLLARERGLADRYNMRFYSFPMSSVPGKGFGAQSAHHAHEAATAAMQAPGKVYLHCDLGQHRVKVVQSMLASLGGRYDHYRPREAQREPALDLAQAYFNAGEYQQALNQIKGRTLQDRRFKLFEGWSLYRLGRIADGPGSFRQTLKDSSRETDAISGLGYYTLLLNRLAEAEEKFKQVLKVIPDDAAALFGGIVKYRPGEDDDSAKYIENGVSSGQPNREAKESLRKVPVSPAAYAGRGGTPGAPN
jgi:tetratricopeptide (TPR) repeat protein